MSCGEKEGSGENAFCRGKSEKRWGKKIFLKLLFRGGGDIPEVTVQNDHIDLAQFVGA